MSRIGTRRQKPMEAKVIPPAPTQHSSAKEVIAYFQHPSADPDAFRFVVEQYPVKTSAIWAAMAKNPNLPLGVVVEHFEQWLKFAPEAILENPVVGLWLLENPNFFTEALTLWPRASRTI